MQVVSEVLAQGGAQHVPSILVVDDEPDVVASATGCLRRYLPWCLVAAATNAREALAMSRRDAFDVVVSDQCMPGMDGLALLRRLRFEQPAVARLLLTGHLEESTAQAALQDGLADALLLKPVSLARLVHTVALQMWLLHQDGRRPLPAAYARDLHGVLGRLGLGLRVEDGHGKPSSVR